VLRNKTTVSSTNRVHVTTETFPSSTFPQQVEVFRYLQWPLGTAPSNGPTVPALNLLKRTSELQTVATFVGTPTLCSMDLGLCPISCHYPNFTVLWGPPKNGLKSGKLCSYGHMTGAVHEGYKTAKMKNAGT